MGINDVKNERGKNENNNYDKGEDVVPRSLCKHYITILHWNKSVDLPQSLSQAFSNLYGALDPIHALSVKVCTKLLLYFVPSDHVQFPSSCRSDNPSQNPLSLPHFRQELCSDALRIRVIYCDVKGIDAMSHAHMIHQKGRPQSNTRR